MEVFCEPGRETEQLSTAQQYPVFSMLNQIPKNKE
jgi:hypothetical protein